MKLKHKITLLVIGILLVVSLLISSSYALWVFNVSQESTNVLVSDCFEITLTDNNPIGLSSSFPMRDSDGVQTTPYTFTIRNICNHPADFQINLETLATSTIDEEFIKADLNGHITEYNVAESVEPTIDGAKSAAMLYEDTLAVNGKKTYNLRLWINENATQDDVENKAYASKISIKATVRKQYAEETLIFGDQFNIALKKIAGDINPTIYTANTSVTSIQRSLNPPSENDNVVLLSYSTSSKKICAWFKDGIIYIYSEADKIYMNADSRYIFMRFKNLTSIDLSFFDTSKVTNMQAMFYQDSGLTSLDVSNFDTSNVTSMFNMFMGLGNITNLDVSNFDTSKVTNMSNMFYGMSKLTSLDVSNFDTSNVTNMQATFYNLGNITNLDVSNFNTSKVTNMSNMFYAMSKLTSLDVSNFDTSNVTNMQAIFYNLSNITNLDVSNFDTSNVTAMTNMFNGMTSLISLDVSNFNTSKVTTMWGMFQDLKNVNELDVSNFDTSNVTNMTYMFSGLNRLTSLDVSNFDTSNVTNMSGMFGSMSALTSLDVSNFDTSKVTNMTYMFSGLNSLTSLDVSNFDTSKVTNMTYMFSGLNSLTSLDVSNFDTSNVTSMFSMFSGMNKLKIIYVGNYWNTSSISSNEYMFSNDVNLMGGAGTAYSSSHTDAEYARIDDPDNGKPGYFTLKTN